MLGWINQSIEAFVTDTFGAEAWRDIVAASGARTDWVSSCPYSDGVTYELSSLLVWCSLIDVGPLSRHALC